MRRIAIRTNQFVFLTLALFIFSWAMQAEAADAQLVRRLNNHLDESAERGFSGAVLIVEDGEIILSKGFGLANKEENIRNTAQTVFDIASLTKQFTGAAILKLVEHEKLEVQDPLSKFFKDVPADKKDITVHQLLTHTSGISSYTGDDYDFISTEQFLKEAFNRKLKSKPGEMQRYANVNYSLLAIILEQVSGQDYEAFLNQHLFQPAGMRSTGYLIPQWEDHTIAQGYDYGKNKRWGTNLERWAEDGGVSWHLKGNGGILSTVEDMYKWHVALEAHKILPPTLKETYEAPHVKIPEYETTYYGYGWETNNDPSAGKKIIRHTGYNGFFYAMMRRFLHEDRVTIFMTNEVRLDVIDLDWHVSELLKNPDNELKPIAKSSWWDRLVTRVYRLFGLL